MTELLTLAASTAPGLPLGITEGGTWLLRNAWLIPLLPGLSFVGILFFGKRMPRGGSELGIALVGIAFVLSLLTAAAWIDHRDNFEGDAELGSTPRHSLAEEEDADERQPWQQRDEPGVAQQPGTALGITEGQAWCRGGGEGEQFGHVVSPSAGRSL